MKLDNGDKAVLRWIYSTSKAQHLRLVLLIAGNAAFAAASVVFALMCRGIVDGAAGKQSDMVIRYGIGLFAVIAAMLLLRLFCNSVDETARAKLEISYRELILSSVLKKDYKNISAYHSGDLLNRMFSDVSVVTDGLVGILPSLAGLTARLIGAAAVLMALDPSFTLLFIAAGLVLFFVSRLLRGRIKHLHKAVQETDSRQRSFLQETLESLLVIKSFGAEDKMQRRNQQNQSAHFKARMKRRSVSILANAGFGFIFQSGYLYAILWGGFKIIDGTMSYGTLTAILQLVNQIQQPFATLSGLLPRLYGMIASAERITELMELPEEPPTEKTADYNNLSRISIDSLCFSYGENSVLNNLNISIEKGDFVSLTGISGGGKTSLFLLLLGAYSPDEGSIRFHCTDGTFSAGGGTRGLFAYVPQGNFLFSGTVRDNIAFLNESATDEEIMTAAETACALEFIQALPDGFDTPVGQNGFGISEGQAQRIAVARAILGGAPILLLDEATSALDESTEARLLENIAQMKNKTVLIVTHRKKALDICNKQLRLKDGEILSNT